MLDATRSLKIYKYRTGTTQFVPGATIQIYKVPEEYVEYLTDRVEVDLEGAFAEDPTDTGYNETPEAKDSTDLSEYLSGILAENTEHRDTYRSKVTLKYSLSKEDLATNRTFTQTLPKEFTLDESDLGKEMLVRDNGVDAFSFVLTKAAGGHTLKVSFDDAYATDDTKAAYHFYVTFDVTIDESAVRAGGSITVNVKDGLALKIAAKDIKEVSSELNEKPVTIKLTEKDLVETVKTKNGPVTVDELESGWYIALETKAPSGYILDKTPQVFKVTNTTTEQSLVFYNQKKASAPSGGGSSEPTEPTPETPETPTPGKPPIGKLVLRFKKGWNWNNVRTEDTGEAGRSIILSIENENTVPKTILGGSLLTLAAAGCGCAVFILLKRRKKQQEMSQ